MEATVSVTLDLSKSFYAKVAGDYRVYIPAEFRRALDVKPGDVVWLIVGTVISAGGSRVIVP
ncbi:MAG: AbrB/MazE/SpoVT family DNA-binding domain-containing protein [Nitrososphaerota archaeon]